MEIQCLLRTVGIYCNFVEAGSNGLCFRNTFFQHRDFPKCTWYKPSMAQNFLKDLCNFLSDLLLEVLDVQVKQLVKLSADHHLVVCSLRLPKPWLNRKSQCYSVAYGINGSRQQYEKIVSIQHSIKSSENLKME